MALRAPDSLHHHHHRHHLNTIVFTPAISLPPSKSLVTSATVRNATICRTTTNTHGTLEPGHLKSGRKVEGHHGHKTSERPIRSRQITSLGTARRFLIPRASSPLPLGALEAERSALTMFRGCSGQRRMSQMKLSSIRRWSSRTASAYISWLSTSSPSPQATLQKNDNVVLAPRRRGWGECVCEKLVGHHMVVCWGKRCIMNHESCRLSARLACRSSGPPVHQGIQMQAISKR